MDFFKILLLVVMVAFVAYMSWSIYCDVRKRKKNKEEKIDDDHSHANS